MHGGYWHRLDKADFSFVARGMRPAGAATVVGAIPGALPAVIGWTAATNSLSAGGWVLFGIVFLPEGATDVPAVVSFTAADTGSAGSRPTLTRSGRAIRRADSVAPLGSEVGQSASAHFGMPAAAALAARAWSKTLRSIIVSFRWLALGGGTWGSNRHFSC